MISYRIEVAHPAAHRFRVTMHIPSPAAQTTLALPVWIPGSYMVREFGRHLSGFEARQGETTRPCRALDKTTWQVDCEGAAPLELSFDVYAFDTSVRTAYLDDRLGFFNPTSLCPRVAGREAEAHQIQIASLPAEWRVATAMPAGEQALSYLSQDYDELVDHPFELGTFWQGHFEAGGVLHDFVVAGAWPGFDGERLLADTRRICEEQIRFWHGDDQPPFQRYVFMLNVVEEGYGGLEHRASTALIANRRDLPRLGQDGLERGKLGENKASEGYLTVLGLISHEYFHTWNVKRLKPAEFSRFDYSRENYTELLWFFEGFTSYYDDLMLLRAGLIDAPRYLKLISRTVNGVADTPGRLRQSVAEASFDAWVKYYRPDENSPNSGVSYYTKGALIGLLLDLRLRAATPGASLDVLMRHLWQHCPGGALTQTAVVEAVSGLGTPALAQALLSWVHGRDDLPLRAALEAAGIQALAEPESWATSLGLRLSEGPVTGVQVKAVLAGSVAAEAGVSAGDELLAVDGWRIRRFDDARLWIAPGAALELLLVRQQRVRTLRLAAPATPADATDAPLRAVALRMVPEPPERAAALRRDWLGC